MRSFKTACEWHSMSWKTRSGNVNLTSLLSHTVLIQRWVWRHALDSVGRTGISYLHCWRRLKCSDRVQSFTIAIFSFILLVIERVARTNHQKMPPKKSNYNTRSKKSSDKGKLRFYIFIMDQYYHVFHAFSDKAQASKKIKEAREQAKKHNQTFLQDAVSIFSCFIFEIIILISKFIVNFSSSWMQWWCLQPNRTCVCVGSISSYLMWR